MPFQLLVCPWPVYNEVNCEVHHVRIFMQKHRLRIDTSWSILETGSPHRASPTARSFAPMDFCSRFWRRSPDLRSATAACA